MYEETHGETYAGMVPRDEVSGRHTGADQEISGGAETILLVEDEAFVREVTVEVLRSAGYCVLTARNGAEAERVYDESNGEVELLLTDVVLPGETGRALAGRLRRERPLLKVLLVTGYPEQMEQGEAPREECLAKPFSTEALLRRVRRVLDRNVLRRELDDPVRQACGNG
jgi:two-component system cell cycle sensor histidine kinase/response regulator CckA